jgi:KDO2-lipid IV(A) lauroyltransferase
MNRTLYWLARGVIAVVQFLPLVAVAWVGRAGGQLGWWFDRRHREVAVANLTECFGGEKSAPEIRALARENVLRLGENYGCAIKAASLSSAEMVPHLEWHGLERLRRTDGRCGVIVVGHFGNFELFGRLVDQFPDQSYFSTYRALRQPRLNALMQAMRAHPRRTFYERRDGAEALKQELARGDSWLLLVADQHAGARGLWLPFLGRDCSCSASPAVFALRYDRPLITAICTRTGAARWRIDVGEWIPERSLGRRRGVEDLTRDVNSAFEVAVRLDPANWFWVHRRWKPASPYQQERQARTAARPGKYPPEEPV